MTEIDPRIGKFIAKHHVLTLATATADGEPYCCNVFYAYDKTSGAFIFTSDEFLAAIAFRIIVLRSEKRRF